MRYHYLEGATQKKSSKKRWLISMPLLLLLVGAYVVININAPLLQGIDGRSSEATARRLSSLSPGSEGDRIFIPQINVDIPITGSDNAAALAVGAVHPSEDAATPAGGGTFVVGARRLNVGITPMQTKTQSPFYNLDKLQPGDELFVDWHGKRYVYQIKDQIMVDNLAALTKNATNVKASSLALYTADQQGGLEGDIALKAVRVGTVAWGSKPIIQRTDSTTGTD